MDVFKKRANILYYNGIGFQPFEGIDATLRIVLCQVNEDLSETDEFKKTIELISPEIRVYDYISHTFLIIPWTLYDQRFELLEALRVKNIPWAIHNHHCQCPWDSTQTVNATTYEDACFKHFEAMKKSYLPPPPYKFHAYVYPHLSAADYAFNNDVKEEDDFTQWSLFKNVDWQTLVDLPSDG